MWIIFTLIGSLLVSSYLYVVLIKLENGQPKPFSINKEIVSKSFLFVKKDTEQDKELGGIGFIALALGFMLPITPIILFVIILICKKELNYIDN